MAGTLGPSLMPDFHWSGQSRENWKEPISNDGSDTQREDSDPAGLVMIRTARHEVEAQNRPTLSLSSD